MRRSTRVQRKALSLVAKALQVPTPKRGAFLDQACGEDADLRRYVQAILGQHDKEARLPEIIAPADVIRRVADEYLMVGGNSDSGIGGTPPPTPSPMADAEMPERIGKFLVRRRLGTGGFGQLYQAYDEELRRDVALKVLKPELRPYVDHFTNEARAVAALRHPGIVTVYGFHVHDGLPVIEYEFVEGGDLRQLLAPHARPTWRATARLIADTASALQYAHEHDYVHLDIKPANILLDKSGRPKIADFGLAVSTRELMEGKVLRAHTPGYAPPEQLNGRIQEYGPWSDIFSLGAVLYELLTGRPPLPLGAQHAAAEANELSAGGAAAGLPESIMTICTEALAPEPSRRFRSAAQMRRALLRAIGVGAAKTRRKRASTREQPRNARGRGPFNVASGSQDGESSSPGQRWERDSPEAVRARILSFDAFLAEHTRDFVGRDFVWKALDHLLADPCYPSGYFVIRGEPGIGKTALMAQLVQARRCPIHHFNIALQGIDTPRHFLTNICARLITHFRLPYSELPAGHDRDGAFLNGLLSAVTAAPGWSAPLLIVVDALDEVVHPAPDQGANVLYLPPSLPDGVYVVATTRFRCALRLRADHQRTYDIDANSDANREDAERYIERHLPERGIQRWIRAQSVKPQKFLSTLLRKSEGNFMYLRHVLGAIAAGVFQDLTLKQLPEGLLAYYRSHWEQMHRRCGDTFESVYQPVVCVLAAVREAVSVNQIAAFTGVARGKVRQVIRDWREFLYEEPVRPETRWRLYHKAFQAYLSDEIDPDLRGAHSLIAEHYMGTLPET